MVVPEGASRGDHARLARVALQQAHDVVQQEADRLPHACFEAGVELGVIFPQAPLAPTSFAHSRLPALL